MEGAKVLNLKCFNEQAGQGTKGSGDRGSVGRLTGGDRDHTPRLRSEPGPPRTLCEAPLVINCPKRPALLLWPEKHPPWSLSIQGFRPESLLPWHPWPGGTPRKHGKGGGNTPPAKLVNGKLVELPMTQLYENTVQRRLGGYGRPGGGGNAQ